MFCQQTLVRQSQLDFPAGLVRAFGVLMYTRTLGEKVKVLVTQLFPTV